MRGLLVIALLAPALGCTDDGIATSTAHCPEGHVWFDGECVPEEEVGSGDGSTEGDADHDGSPPDAADGGSDRDVHGDLPADGETDAPGDAISDPPPGDGDPGCLPPRMMCDGRCVDPRSDPMNCGGCGVVCGDNGPSCVAGACMCASDPACAPCDATSCGACETCCPREGCMPMDEFNCGGCSVSCHPLDQCGQYLESGVCTLVCEEAFDPSRHYVGLFDITPHPPSTTCSSSFSFGIDRLHFTVPRGDLNVRGFPFLLVQSPVPTTADFVVVGRAGCNVVTLTGHFRNANVFQGTWAVVPVSGCTDCLADSIAITGTRHGVAP
jgi:hypothetical protein